LSLSVGMRLGPYEIQSAIGAGGMGEVYKARDTRLDRSVAVKVLPAGVASDPDRHRRFEQEARTVAALNHTHICTLYDIGHEGNTDFLVMELLDGETLAQRLRAGPLPIAQALDLGAQIADALAAAHRRHVVHRDLKPANIMLVKAGAALHVKLLDFGLAKLTTPAEESVSTSSLPTQEALTAPGAVAGTVPYMAPEQLEGKEADARADLFAFGCVLYEMLTGRRAFVGQTKARVIAAILTSEPPSVSTLRPLTPPALDRLVNRCLGKDPEARWQDAADVAEELRGILTDSAVSRSTNVSAAPRRSGRHVTGAMVVVSLLVLIVAVAAFLVANSIERRGPFAGVAARQLTSGIAEGDPAVSPDGSLVAYSAEEDGSHHIWVADTRTGATLQLTRGEGDDRYPCWTPDQASVLFSSDRDGGGVFTVSRLGSDAPRLVVPNAAEPAVSPDGSRIAFTRRPSAGGNQRIFLVGFGDARQARQVTFDRDGLWDHLRPAWSKDSRGIVYRAQMSLWRVDVDRKGATRLTRESQYCDRPVWAPDGSIYYGSKIGGTYGLWRLPSGREPGERVTPGAGERDPSLSSDGQVLAYATVTQDFNLVLHEMQSGLEERFGGVRVEYLPAFSSDGSEIFFVGDLDATSGDQIWAVKVAGGKFSGTPRRLTDPPGFVSHPDCSPDGKWLLYYRIIGDQRNVWVVATSGGPPIQVTNGTAPDTTAAWDPDGRRIAFTSERDGRSRIWVVPFSSGAPVGPAVRLTAGSYADEAPAWSPNGGEIAYVETPPDGVGDVWLIPSDGGRPARRLTVGAGAQRVHWDPRTANLLVSGWWDSSRISVRLVDPYMGFSRGLEPPLVFGSNPFLIDFDVSRDGRSVVFSRDDSRSNIWVLDTRRNQ
jgi:eukaryotic-like serine/threonine-protein kinase